jgi:hypothetical protein
VFKLVWEKKNQKNQQQKNQLKKSPMQAKQDTEVSNTPNVGGFKISDMKKVAVYQGPSKCTVH